MFTINKLDAAEKEMIDDILSKINKSRFRNNLIKQKDMLLDTAEDDFKIHVRCGSEHTNDFDSGLKVFVAISIFDIKNTKDHSLIYNMLELENESVEDESINKAFDECLELLKNESATKPVGWKPKLVNGKIPKGEAIRMVLRASYALTHPDEFQDVLIMPNEKK